MGIYFKAEIINGSFTANQPWFNEDIDIMKSGAADSGVLAVNSVIDNNESISFTLDGQTTWTDFARDANQADRFVATKAGVKKGDKVNFRTQNASTVKFLRIYLITGVTA